MRIYFDSSALAKLYIQEKGSDKVQALCSVASELMLSCIVVTEFFSALNRRLREGILNKEQYSLLKREFLLDCEDATIIDLSPEIIKISIDCLEKTSLRAFDAIHVASAKDSLSDLFVSADLKQYEAAKKLKLSARYIGD